MKRLAAILVLFLPCVCLSQEPWHLWAQHEAGQLDTFIAQHRDSLSYFLDMQDDEWFTQAKFEGNIHLMDLDQDGDLDGIYNGFVGAESDMVEFWIATPLGLDRSRYAVGEIREIFGSSERFFVRIFEPGCCADTHERNVLLEVQVQPDRLDLQEVKRVESAVEETKPFWEFSEPIPFRVLQPTYRLRLAPSVDNDGEFHPDLHGPGNILQEYTHGDTGRALGQDVDDTGRVWWYVEMAPSASNPIFQTGWMSSRFLEVIPHE